MNIFIINKTCIIKFIVIFLLIFCIITTIFQIYKYIKSSTSTFQVSSNNEASGNFTLQEKIDAIYSSKEKVAYLTFDDGPTKVATPQVLDILKAEDVKATFLLLVTE